MTEQEVTVAREDFGITGYREVCAEGEGLLAEEGGRGVVYSHQGSALLCGRHEFSKIA